MKIILEINKADDDTIGSLNLETNSGIFPVLKYNNTTFEVNKNVNKDDIKLVASVMVSTGKNILKALMSPDLTLYKDK